MARPPAGRHQPSLFDPPAPAEAGPTPDPSATATARTSSFASRLPARPRPTSLFDLTPDPADVPAPPAVEPPPLASDPPVSRPPTPDLAPGEVGKARDLIAAVRALKSVEREARPPTAAEADALARYPGFGPVALTIFPHAQTGRYKDATWEALGRELEALLTPAERDSARRTTFTAFYTPPAVMRALYAALDRLGTPADARVLEPGCGAGHFLARAPTGYRFLGVEQDSLSARLARARFPQHDLRQEPFQDTKLPDSGLDAVVGNVPFADLTYAWAGRYLPLHDYFLVKSVAALAPGGVLASVTSHFTLDKQTGTARDFLADQADFLGAIRLPSDAFKREGTAVVTDLVFFRRRAAGEPPRHADPSWLAVAPLKLGGHSVSVNAYFLARSEQVLGTFSRQDTLHGRVGYSVTPAGELEPQLTAAIARLPELPRRATAAPARPAAPHFVPPPADAPTTEGSFVVGDDRRLYQIEGGRLAPVVYGGVTLTAYGGGITGRRLAALVGLRDRARRVLRSQNEGWPEADRLAARSELNRAYDAFASAYGPVNKTTLTETEGGGTVRRMPNLVKFRDDPDAVLVMALEEYDEDTGVATKAPILKGDVVGPTPVVTAVESAEAGLLVSLDRRGGVDLPFIAALSGRSEAEVVAELGSLIYRDPETRTWQTADAYLSGDVRRKLRAAQAAGPDYARNAAALAEVQPEDLLPGDIDANLGAPWLAEADIRAFASHLFGTQEAGIQVAHLPHDAVWSVSADYGTERSVAATADYGTGRVGGVQLLELALNLKAPTVYDPVPGDPDRRQVNPEATLAARDKQRLIKEKFKGWVFSDPDRTERLVRAYNDAFNALRPRQFDGSHLQFPGMTQGLSLRPHQRDAVWRATAGGNTLLAHVVGAGKTFTMAAAAMKLKQARLVRKPMAVVPNHLLEQFSREWLLLYPNARLLVAAKEDLSRDRRKRLTARIAGGDWDGVVVTHSSFERMGMSADFQADFLRGQIAAYDRLLADRAGARSEAGRNLIKAVEKQKARREDKLKELLAADRKDDGLVFDELGVDQLFVDEAHAYKNLETATKMDRVAGVQTGGSERAFDLLMKATYLHQKNPGRGLVFATGTPVSNTMVELYTLQRYLDPDGLAARGIQHFDAWAATFGEVVEALEISPDGASLRPRSRFAKFVNLPELQQLFLAFADVQTADMLDLPRPRLAGGKAHVVACPMSDAQSALQGKLVGRYDRLRSQKVDPREDNALAITTDGRKLALDPRLLDPAAGDHPASKLNALVATVSAVWGRTAAIRGTQLVFCDLGVAPSPAGFSVYDALIDKLAAAGIPRREVAAVGEADSDAKKQALFERVRQGAVRVLVGSTQKMGAGTNVQRRLVALHHLDAPWKPAEVEQREGRILRQGNQNAEVEIYRYVTEGSFDAYMWQALETKAKFIGQVMTGRVGLRRAEDVAGAELSYAEVKAIASGNPAVLTLAEADAEIQRLSVLRKHHADEQYTARRTLRDLPEVIETHARRRDGLSADRATLAAHATDPIRVGGREPADPVAALAQALNRVPDNPLHSRRYPLGTYGGLTFGIEPHPGGGADVYLEGRTVCDTSLSRESQGPRAVLNALARLAAGYPATVEAAAREVERAERQRADYQARLGSPFPQGAYLDELTELRDQLRLALAAPDPVPAADDTPAEQTPAELADRITALKAAQAASPLLPDDFRTRAAARRPGRGAGRGTA